MVESFFYLLILLLILLVFGTMAFAGLSAAPWVPTRKKDVERLINLAEIKKGELVYELGSGDGRNIIEIAKRYEVIAYGFEISVLPYLYSKIKIWLLNNFFAQELQGKVIILYQDLFLQKLSKADVIICFLTPRTMKRLEEKFKKELKKGCRVISYIFPLKSLNPKTIDKPTSVSNSIYLYHF